VFCNEKCVFCEEEAIKYLIAQRRQYNENILNIVVMLTESYGSKTISLGLCQYRVMLIQNYGNKELYQYRDMPMQIDVNTKLC
jgi:hypothetical protein